MDGAAVFLTIDSVVSPREKKKCEWWGQKNKLMNTFVAIFISTKNNYKQKAPTKTG